MTPQGPTRPILVMMSWRGGDRLARCLSSIAPALPHFSRVVLSITADASSDDMAQATEFSRQHPSVEVICTGRELPTMQHQAFWIDHLQRTGSTPNDWILWLAYDDALRLRGIESIVDARGDWPLASGTAYFGPWALRHEDADRLWEGDPTAPVESWTSFPASGPLRLPLLTWIDSQLRQPTYMQMSGSLCQLRNFIELRDGRPRKAGPMRIEMATAAGSTTTAVAELPEPITIIYGRSNSDRASYGPDARREDLHLIARLARHAVLHPHELPALAALLLRQALSKVRLAVGVGGAPSEEWRVRAFVDP